MTCPKCGNNVREGGAFCLECGEQFKVQEAPRRVASTAQTSAWPETLSVLTFAVILITTGVWCIVTYTNWLSMLSFSHS